MARGGVFTSVTDLRRKLMRYIKQYKKTAKPVPVGLRRSDEAHRMIAVQVVRTFHRPVSAFFEMIEASAQVESDGVVR